MSNFTSLSLREQAILQCDDHDIRFLLDQHPYLNCIAHWYNYPRGHVTLIPNQQVFVLNCTSLAETKTNRNLMVRIAHLFSFLCCVFFCFVCHVSCVPNVASLSIVHLWLHLRFSLTFIIVFGFIRQGLEPTIYHTRGSTLTITPPMWFA